MKSIRIHEYGGRDSLVYEDAPKPSPNEGNVLLKVYNTSVNPFDCAARAGYLQGFITYEMPHILGCDAAGVVEAVGPGVTTFAPGDSVYTRVNIFGGGGAYAEYVVVSAADVVKKPETLDYPHAAALPHVALTAWQALFETAQLSSGQRVLIHGAAGGVGHMAVQLAKTRGAYVIGTASANNLDFLRELGVDEAIDYTAAPFETVVHDVDIVFDTVGGETQQRSWEVLKPGGILISIVSPPSAEEAAARGVRQAFVSSSPAIGPVLREIATLVDAGQIRPVISRVLPLQEIVRAHELVEGRHTRGKLVLEVAS